MNATLSVLSQGFNQVGVIVSDLEAAIRRYQSQFGMRCWDVYTYDSQLLSGMTYHGNAADYSMQIALSSDMPGTQIELILPLSGQSIYTDHVRSVGYGFHHFGVHCDDISATIPELQRSGFPVIQEGWGFCPAGDGYFAYIDTSHALGYIIELRQPPSNRWPPEKRYS